MDILIVDDERLVRLTLQSMIEEIYGDKNHISQAGNAGEMYRMLEKKTFDLVFLDINMPQKQGLDAMEQVKDRYRGTDWCVLTGYGYFEYVKKALKLGAKGYLLKPPDPDELREFIDNLLSERQERRKKERGYFAETIRKGIYLDDFSELEYLDEQYYLYTFFVDVKEERRRDIYQNLYQCLEHFLNSQLNVPADEFALFTGATGEVYLLILGEERGRMNSFLKLRFHEYTEEAFVSGYSARLDGVKELKTTLALMTALAPLRLYLENLDIFRMEGFDSDPDVIEKQYLCGQLEKLTSEYLIGDMEGFNHILKQISEGERWAGKEKSMLTEEVVEHLSIIWGAEFKSNDINEMLKKMKRLFMEKHMKEDPREDIILQIRKYVDGNYMDDVSIERMGVVFGVTPTYLSRIFREKTGEKYIDYVTGIRMKKAEELLETQKYSIRRVSEQVGYSSEKYFSRLFKKHFGVSPSQYMRKELKQ